jgi:transcriptional regulator with XRE-family HTH domain
MTQQKHPLRAAREARHWSIDTLAETTGLSRRTILRAEQGHGLNPASRRLLCRGFDMSAGQLGLTLRQPVRQPGCVASRYSEIDDLNRREFLRLLSLAGTLLVVPPVESRLDWERMQYFADRTRRPDQQTLEQYAALQGHLWRTFASPGSRSASFRIVQNQLDVLTRNLEQSHGPTMHQRLCALAGDLFQLAGEILFDANQYADAAHCYTSAACASKEAGAFDLWACAMTRHAFIAIYEGRFDSALPMLDLADRLALSGDDALSTRHWVNAVRARALAGLGEMRAFERAIAMAERVQQLEGPLHNGGWLRFDSSRLAEERGACHLELRQTDLAEAALTTALTQGLSSRRRGIVLTDLAMVGLQRHDPSQVATYVTPAIHIATETRSGVVGRRLQALRPHLAPLLADPGMRQIDQRIANLATGSTVRSR